MERWWGTLYVFMRMNMNGLDWIGLDWIGIVMNGTILCYTTLYYAVLCCCHLQCYTVLLPSTNASEYGVIDDGIGEDTFVIHSFSEDLKESRRLVNCSRQITISKNQHK